jgi:hypothetical protein
VVVQRDARTNVVDWGDPLNAEGAEEEEGGVALQRVPCDWRVGTSIAAQSGGEACGTGGELSSGASSSQLVPLTDILILHSASNCICRKRRRSHVAS